MRKLVKVLKRAHAAPFKLKSDFAREHAIEVAAAASMGWISSLEYSPGNIFGDRWQITTAGLKRLELEL